MHISIYPRRVHSYSPTQYVQLARNSISTRSRCANVAGKIPHKFELSLYKLVKTSCTPVLNMHQIVSPSSPLVLSYSVCAGGQQLHNRGGDFGASPSKEIVASARAYIIRLSPPSSGNGGGDPPRRPKLKVSPSAAVFSRPQMGRTFSAYCYIFRTRGRYACAGKGSPRHACTIR